MGEFPPPILSETMGKKVSKMSERRGCLAKMEGKTVGKLYRIATHAGGRLASLGMSQGLSYRRKSRRAVKVTGIRFYHHSYRHERSNLIHISSSPAA
jgi:hypothetical protein